MINKEKVIKGQSATNQTYFDFDYFCNYFGSLRVKKVRRHYGITLKKEDLPDIVDLYKTWRDTVEIMPMRLTYEVNKTLDIKNTPIDPDVWISQYNYRTGKTALLLNEDVITYQGLESEWIYKKCCKRGNDVYIDAVKKKFKPLIQSSNHKSFFSIRVNDKRKRVRKTKLLYITGTCDQEITGDISNSWSCFGLYWNSFITNIREMFNGVEFVRSWQSQKNGYPHFHALIYFTDFEFTTVRWIEKDGSVSWRVHNRQQLNGEPVRYKIKNAWKWGDLDIKCCDNTKKAIVDLVKYITRDLEGGESDLTNAMVWYYGKQSYSFSKGFLSLFEQDINIGEPTDDDLINAEGVIQRSNSKKKLVRIEIFPVLKYSILEDRIKNTLYFWEDQALPPPPIIDFLDNYVYSCKPVKLNVKELEDGSCIEVISYENAIC